jgi:uncharacterized membrane protein
MNTVDLELEFDVGHCNGSMSLTVMYNDSIIDTIENIADNQHVTRTQISLPGVIKILVSNKNMNTDTKVDVHGTVIEDKYIQLKEMRLGRITVSTSVLKNLCAYTHNKTVTDTYWGFPGMIEIKLDQEEVVAWHLIHNPTNFNVSRN